MKKRVFNARNNTCIGNAYGIEVLNSANTNLFVGNNCSFNKKYGIYLYEVEYEQLIGNNCIGNDNGDSDSAGIYLYGSIFNNITSNFVELNGYEGICLNQYSNSNLIENNTCINQIYDEDDPGMGIDVEYSNLNVINNNTCTGNLYYGIYLDESNNCTISGNNCNSTIYGEGIETDNSGSNTLTFNFCNNDGDDGIYLWFSELVFDSGEYMLQ